MKITDFKRGKQYFLPEWDNENYLYITNNGTLLFCDKNPYIFSFDELISNRWQEYKEPIDYGTKDNHKLFLLQGETETFWGEGYYFDENHIICIFHTEIIICNKDILKVIDLPSKELTNE